MVDFVMSIGGTAINVQPVEKGTVEVDEELWIGPDEMDAFVQVRDTLLGRKQNGAPILNSEALL